MVSASNGDRSEMENPEEVLQWLEEVSRRRSSAYMPRELDEYLELVARTGDPMYGWPLVRTLLKEKLTAVVADFRAAPPGLDVPHCPNVPPFDCDAMRACFAARLDAFAAAPFTVQRICELLAHPRKHYNRIDKFMRAFEKNVLVVSTKEPHAYRRPQRDEPRVDENDVDMDAPLNGPLDSSDPSDPEASPPSEDSAESAAQREEVTPEPTVSQTADEIETPATETAAADPVRSDEPPAQEEPSRSADPKPAPAIESTEIAEESSTTENTPDDISDRNETESDRNENESDRNETESDRNENDMESSENESESSSSSSNEPITPSDDSTPASEPLVPDVSEPMEEVTDEKQDISDRDAPEVLDSVADGPEIVANEQKSDIVVQTEEEALPPSVTAEETKEEKTETVTTPETATEPQPEPEPMVP